MTTLNRILVIIFLMFATTASAAEMQLKAGDFTDADQVHQGEGGVVLVKDGDALSIKFVNGFYVTPGPDLFVYLVKNPSPQSSQDVKDSQSYELAKLKTPSGKQTYEIPADIDINDYGSVVIWCGEFGVLFAHAELK